jgi:hypothetical protein
MLGASNLWWVPLSNAFGRRPVMLVATLLMALSTLWCGLSTSYSSLLAARFFQGVGGGAADTVPPTMVGDLYFMDERGRAMVRLTPFPPKNTNSRQHICNGVSRYLVLTLHRPCTRYFSPQGHLSEASLGVT